MKWRNNEANESRIECEEHRKKETEEEKFPIFSYNGKIPLKLSDRQKYSKYIWKSYNSSSYFE